MKIKWGRLVGLVFIGICFIVDPAPAAQKKAAAKAAKVTQKEPARPKAADVTTALVFGKAGNGPGAFGTIDGVWVDPRGRILVADKGNNRISFFTGGGHFLKSFRRTGRRRGPVQSMHGDRRGRAAADHRDRPGQFSRSGI